MLHKSGKKNTDCKTEYATPDVMTWNKSLSLSGRFAAYNVWTKWFSCKFSHIVKFMSGHIDQTFMGFLSHLKFLRGWSHFALKQVSALRCFMSKLCQFWKTCTFMQKNINTHFLQVYWQHGLWPKGGWAIIVGICINIQCRQYVVIY